jgi:hypothetical protein
MEDIAAKTIYGIGWINDNAAVRQTGNNRFNVLFLGVLGMYRKQHNYF